MKLFSIALLLFLISGCAMPTTSVRSVDSRPSLAVKGTSPEAELFIDGLNVGMAITYNGLPQSLVLEPGTHRVTIVEKGKTIYEQTIFIESELKTITVH